MNDANNSHKNPIDSQSMVNRLPRTFEALRDFLQENPELETLELYGWTDLQVLPKLSATLKHLTVKNCPNLICALPFPKGLLELTLINCPKLSPDCFPLSLESLYWENTDVCQFPGLPALKKLSLVNLNYETIKGLPRCIEVLHVSNMRELESIGTLPTELKELRISNCERLQQLGAGDYPLPQNLEFLEIKDSLRNKREFPPLPPALRYLKVTNLTELRGFGELPKELKELHVLNCKSFGRLPILPQNLTNLTLLGSMWLYSLPALPSSIVNLDIRGNDYLKCGRRLRIGNMLISI